MSSPINGLPSYDDNSPNFPPMHFNAWAAVLDSRLIARFATTTARDSAITAPVNGMTVWCDSPGDFYYRIGGAWVRRYSGAWSTYTPTWLAEGATTPPAIGNGTLTGRYRQLNPNLGEVRVFLRLGATSNGGNGTTTQAYSLGLPPSWTAETTVPQTLHGWYKSGSDEGGLTGFLTQGLSKVYPIRADNNNALVANGLLLTANTDFLLLQGTVELA